MADTKVDPNGLTIASVVVKAVPWINEHKTDDMPSVKVITPSQAFVLEEGKACPVQAYPEYSEGPTADRRLGLIIVGRNNSGQLTKMSFCVRVTAKTADDVLKGK